MPEPTGPGYLRLGRAELEARAQEAIKALGDCRLCPRDCGVNRLAEKWAACKTGRHAVVSSCFAHFGEEDCLRGWKGSGTIFFAHCNLRCVFCQNFDISQAIRADRAPPGSGPEELARLMLGLQARGCHNINFVTPEHVVPQVLEGLVPAVGGGLRLPLVYNTSAYDSAHSLDLLDGVVDIYMPDFKFWSADLAQRFLKAKDYPEVARQVIRRMHEQVGPLAVDRDGLARRGLLIRHLVMPGCVEDSRKILEWIAQELGTDTYVNLMDQYRPAGRVTGDTFPQLGRSTSSAEFQQAWEFAEHLGLRLDTRRSWALLR